MAAFAVAVLVSALLSSAGTNTAYAFHTFGGTYVVDMIPGAAQREASTTTTHL
jgi:hypothetical protein